MEEAVVSERYLYHSISRLAVLTFIIAPEYYIGSP